MKTIITILAALACHAIAGADTITQTGSLSGMGGPQTQPVVVAAFDDMGGTRQLQSVSLEAQTSTSGGGQTNSSGIPTHVTVDLIAEYSLNSNLVVATHAMIDITMPNNGPLIAFSVFDTDTQTGEFDQPVDLAAWIGTGNLTLDVFTSFSIVETPPGSLNFGAGGSVNYELVYEYENVGLGTNYCPLTANSVGPGTALSATGSNSIAANDLVIVASGGPATQPGVFFYGPAQIQTPFGEGNRCVGGSIIRVWPPSISDGTGINSRFVDNGVAPNLGVIVDAATLNFQYWHRDPAGGPSGFNLSDGLSVTFVP